MLAHGGGVQSSERKGHHYSVQDTATYDEHGRLLLQQRHTNIFRPAKKPEAAL